MKLLRSTKNEITKDKNGENLPHFVVAEVVLVHCISFTDQNSQPLEIEDRINLVMVIK